MSGILDELVDDIEQDEETKQKKIALEQEISDNNRSINNKVNSISNFKVPVDLPEQLLDKSRRYIDLLATKNDKLKLSTVEFSVAQELFALLPEYIDRAESHKLTKLPSETNTRILKTNIDKYLPKLRHEVISELRSLYIDLQRSSEEIKQCENNIQNAVITFIDSNEDKLDFIENELLIVIKDKKGIDAHTVNIYDLFQLFNTMDYREELYSDIMGAVDTSYEIDKEDLSYIVRFVSTYMFSNNKEIDFESLFTIYNFIEILRKLKAYKNVNSPMMEIQRHLRDLENTSDNINNNEISIINSHLITYDTYARYMAACKELCIRLDKPKNVLDSLQKLVDIFYKLLK